MPAPREPRAGTTVRVLDEDLELAAAVSQDSFREARLAAVAPLVEVPKGPWSPPSEPHHRGRDLGLLVLSGLLLRDLELAGRSLVELRGPEDLLRPWDDATEVLSINPQIRWSAREPTRLAWLDGDLPRASSPGRRSPPLSWREPRGGPASSASGLRFWSFATWICESCFCCATSPTGGGRSAGRG